MRVVVAGPDRSHLGSWGPGHADPIERDLEPLIRAPYVAPKGPKRGTTQHDGACRECGATPRVNRTVLCAEHYAEALARVREALSKREAPGRRSIASKAKASKPTRSMSEIREAAAERAERQAAEKAQRDAEKAAKRAADTRAVVDYVAAHPGVSKVDLIAATRVPSTRVTEAVAAGHIAGRRGGGSGYFITNNNSDQEAA